MPKFVTKKLQILTKQKLFYLISNLEKDNKFQNKINNFNFLNKDR